MLVLLALTACFQVPSPSIVTDEVRPEPESGGLHIATAPRRHPAAIAPVIEAPLPTGEPIVRDCFGGGNEFAPSGGAPARPSPKKKPSSRRPSSSKVPSATPTTGAASAPESAAAPPVVTPSDGSASGFGKGGDGLGDLGGRGSGAPAGNDGLGGLLGGEGTVGASKDRRSTNADSDTPSAAEGDSKPALAAKRELGELQQLEKSAGFDRSEEAEDADDTIVTADAAVVSEPVTPEPVLDWGATVHLSNDDSMSLASAQRVLYALSRGVSLSPSEIRPHELLNYFSFDTAEVPDGQLFSVLGGAEQTDDTLRLSLAVKGANPARQPLDLSLVLDRSCSMNAEGRMEYTQRGLRMLSENLQSGDRVDVVLFDSGVCTPLENYVVGRDDPALLTGVIEALKPTGSTDLDAGLREAYRIQTERDPADRHLRNQRVVLLTDANLNSGNVNDSLVSEVGRQFDDNDIRLAGIGVGRDFNDTMLDKLTEKGKGAYVYLGSEAVVDRVFGPGFDALTRTIAHDVRFSVDLPDSLAMERFYGEEASTNEEDVQPIHYYAGTTQLFLQDLTVRDGTPVRTDPVVMTIRYRDGVTGEPETQQLHTTVGALLDGDPHNLRKAKALMAFTDVVMAQAMRSNPCGAPLAAYRSSLGGLSDDAEVGFVNGLLGRTCGVDLATAVQAGVAYKVKVDSDIPIAEVALACEGATHTQSLSGSDTVARFEVSPGACTVQLQGRVPMQARVEVPEIGGDVRCMVRGGRLSCG